jgi:glycosyltransferase involved in cell wall biosynthesis
MDPIDADGTLGLMRDGLRLSVVIPSYDRHEVLVDSIGSLLPLLAAGDELIVVDQTPEHPASVAGRLRAWNEAGEIRWIRRDQPSIPQAMNAGLVAAAGDVVLFLDDDIRPDEQLLEAHRQAHAESNGQIVAGRVLQPWHGGAFDAAGAFGFNSPEPRMVGEFMGGNVSVPRQAALSLGGYDENFVQVAYRFEADFALRWTRAGGLIRYEPRALIHHLKVPAGGTRVHGDHLRTAQPGHAVGEYYFLLMNRPAGWWWRWLKRPVRSVSTRHHIRRPWWIAPTLLAEFRGMAWAVRLAKSGRRLVSAVAASDGEDQGDNTREPLNKSQGRHCERSEAI